MLLLRVTWIGLLGAAVAAVAGIVMLVDEVALLGTAVVALSVAVGALLWLVSSYVLANTPTSP